MKKFFLFASAALVLASCSSEAEEAVIKPNETPEEEVADLVAIKIGGSRASASSEASTRAANVIEEFNNTKIGIFAVDEATTDPFAVGSVAINEGKAWAQNGVAATATVILNNIPAKAAAPTGAPGTASTVTLYRTSDDSYYPANWYYPRSINDYCYTFIGYYPFSEDTDIFEDEITINGNFDGSQDVMIGRADSKKTEKGYNAKWYRDQTTSPVPAPDIKFNHQTAQVVLHIKQGKGAVSTENNVVEAYFDNEPTTYTLKIDRSGNPSIEWGESVGKAYAIGEVFDNKKVYKTGALVKDANGDLYTIKSPGFNGDGSSQISSVAMRVNDGIAPQSSDFTDYPVFISAKGEQVKKLHVVLQDGTGTDINITAPAERSTFDPGYKYTVLLTIHGPQEIEVSATVSGWNPVSEEITGEI